MMRVLIAALVALGTLVGASSAQAQCGTTLPGGTLCGNRTGSNGLNGPLTNPVLGIPGTSSGQVGLAGATSGTATLRAQAVAGSAVSLLPTAAGTLVGTAVSPLSINATTGQISIVPPFTITPTALSNTQGLVVSQSTPSTGSLAGPVLLNSITVIDNGQSVTDSSLDTFGQIKNQTNALRINYRVTGGTATHGALSIAANITATNGGTYGIASGTYLNVGTVTGDNWGIIAYGNVGPTGNLNQSLIGIESEMLIATGGVARDRVALSLQSQGPVAGTNIDAAIVTSLFNLGITNYMTATPFRDFVYFSNNFFGAGAQSIAVAGNIFRSDAMTIANFANMASVTVTGNILNFPRVQIAGNGQATFNSSTTLGQVQVTNASGGISLINTSTNTTSGTDGFSTADSSNNNNLFAGVAEAAHTATIFGRTVGNWGLVSTIGSTNLGMMVGTRTNVPLVLGTNNAARITVLGAGNVGVGTEINAQAPMVVSKNTATGVAVPNETILAVNGTDATSAVLAFQSYGTGVNATMLMRGARGTAAAPTASQANDVLGFIAANGYAATAYDSASLSGIYIGASENHTLTANGTFLAFLSVTPTTTTRNERMRLGEGLGINTTSDPGAGMIYTNSATFMIRTKTSYANGADAGAGTLANAPAAGNPTKWIPIDDNGTTRYIPAW